MAETSRDEVRRIAALARLQVTEAEAETFRGQFERILGQFRALADLDLEGVEPTQGAPGVEHVLRADAPRPGLEPGAVLGLAPEREGEFFRLPKAVGGEA